jgi:hypothetical protein
MLPSSLVVCGSFCLSINFFLSKCFVGTLEVKGWCFLVLFGMEKWFFLVLFGMEKWFFLPIYGV